MFLITFATAAVVDQEPPVFTNCPSDIVVDDATTSEMRVNWQQPTVTDNSGVPPSVTSNKAPGSLFSVPGSYEIIYTATDGSGNLATCSFTITLKVKTCPMYAPPKNGALACNSIGLHIYCVVMCNDKSDFVFNPPMLYYCSDAQWQFFALFGQPYLKQLPWPDCSNTENPSYFKTTARFSNYFYNGDGNDPNVQATIKTNFISLMTNPSYIPPFICLFKPDECNQDTVQLYVGASTV
ncbi:hypothetical protein ACROYT_G019936 [Oculina patagonica]